MKLELLIVILPLLATHCLSSDIRWDHSVDLDENFRLLWKVKEPDITMEVQVRTHGYVGFGFARSEHIYGADMVIGWVDKHTFFQVSFEHFISLLGFILCIQVKVSSRVVRMLPRQKQ